MDTPTYTFRLPTGYVHTNMWDEPWQKVAPVPAPGPVAEAVCLTGAEGLLSPLLEGVAYRSEELKAVMRKVGE